MTTKTFQEFIRSLDDNSDAQRILGDQFEMMGISYNQSLTVEQLRAGMIEHGIRPEDNLFSCGIIAARDKG